MQALIDKLRMSPWLGLTVVLALAVWAINPAQLEVAAWKMLLLSGAAYLGYWIDRNVFPYARPHTYLDGAEPEGDDDLGSLFIAALSMLRRAIIIAAVVVGAALAV